MAREATARLPDTPDATHACDTKLHPVDVEVGRRIRVRRLQLRMSQTALGTGIGISFQQVQKYERGMNRVSSSALYAIANVLDVPMSYFFETLPRPGKGNTAGYSNRANARNDFVATSEGQRLVDAFVALPHPMRSKFIALLAAFNDPGR